MLRKKNPFVYDEYGLVEDLFFLDHKIAFKYTKLFILILNKKIKYNIDQYVDQMIENFFKLTNIYFKGDYEKNFIFLIFLIPAKEFRIKSSIKNLEAFHVNR